MQKWSHPGGKLRELGAETLSEAELLAILISTGIRGKPAKKIADEIVERFGFLAEMANVPLERFLEIKGLSDVKIIRMQARGLWGPRHICKKVLELPIPQFDPSEEAHLELAELGRACTQRVADWLEAGGPGKVRSIGKLRSMARGMLAVELSEIDRLVRPLLGIGESTSS